MRRGEEGVGAAEAALLNSQKGGPGLEEASAHQETDRGGVGAIPGSQEAAIQGQARAPSPAIEYFFLFRIYVGLG